MNIRLFALCLFIIVLTFGCSQKDLPDNQDNNNAQDAKNVNANITGIRVSEWYKSEKYNRDVIDIRNFDEINRTIRITTICYGNNKTEIPSNDSEIITIPPLNQWTWVPVCPREAVSYTIKIG